MTLCPASSQPQTQTWSTRSFNLGRGEPVVNRDFVTFLERLVGKAARWKNAPLPPTEMVVTFADTSKARRRLGYLPRVSIEEGLTRFWEWYQISILNLKTSDLWTRQLHRHLRH